MTVSGGIREISGQQAAACAVAARPDAGDVGMAEVVGHDALAVGLDMDLLQADALHHRAAAGGVEHQPLALGRAAQRAHA